MHIEVEQISAYLDGQLALAERTRMESHLQGCAVCRDELESLRRTVALVQALPRVSTPRAFTLSEAQVGIRQRDAQPAWRGGLLRGLGTATALALVALVAITVLRPPGWVPSAPVAREAPAEARAPKEIASTAAPAAPAAAPQSQAFSVETVVVEKAVEVAVTKEAAATDQPLDTAATMTPQPTAVPPSAKAAQPAATATAEQPMLGLAPAPEAAPAMAATAAGRGGGPAAGFISPEALTPEALPQLRPIGEVLPAGVHLAYADLKAVWAVDRETGARQLAQAAGASTPQISPDGRQVMYRALAESATELWVVRWDGANAHRLLSDRDLPKTGLAPEYAERRILEARWLPGKPAIAVSLTAIPAPSAPNAPAKTELWYLDAATGGLRYVTDLGRALWWPAFSPQGDRFALLQYGTEAQPQGTLTLFDADGGNGRVALRFPAGPARLSYERQLAWSPDGQTLWLALPDADGQLNGTTLYRIPVKGEAQAFTQLDAHQVAWSPAADRLLFTRYISDAMETVELYLAGGDGADPQLYATTGYGEIVNWSPDGGHFIYQDNFHLYAGSPDAAPQRLGNQVSLVEPRWISASQFVSLHDAGNGWLLTLRSLDGSAAGLLPLPLEAMLDVGRP